MAEMHHNSGWGIRRFSPSLTSTKLVVLFSPKGGQGTHAIFLWHVLCFWGWAAAEIRFSPFTCYEQRLEANVPSLPQQASDWWQEDKSSKLQTSAPGKQMTMFTPPFGGSVGGIVCLHHRLKPGCLLYKILCMYILYSHLMSESGLFIINSVSLFFSYKINSPQGLFL